jgi:hypothetical protein
MRFKILCENKINDRRKRIYTEKNKMYVGQLFKNPNYFLVILEINQIIIDAILDIENLEKIWILRPSCKSKRNNL